MGNSGVVGSGGVQFMSAGTGVRHSEYATKDGGDLHLVQMWVLPGTLGAAPSYGQLDFTAEDRRNRWLPVASGIAGVQAPIALTQRASLQVARLENHALAHAFAPQRYGFLFVAEGDVRVNGESLSAGDAVRTYGVDRLEIAGTGELVLWDVPGVDDSEATA
jgi:hypothetical protein